MFHTTRATYESGVLRRASVHLDVPALTPARERQDEMALDEALAESFPASDPPSWNSGIARVASMGGPRNATRPPPANDGNAGADTPGVIDVSPPDRSERTVVPGLISLAGASGVSLFVPAAILLVGTPVALVVRGALDLFQWFSKAFR